MNDYRIERKIKGTRVFFFPTVNGKRLTRTNFARKYDARATLRSAVSKYGETRLRELTLGAL